MNNENIKCGSPAHHSDKDNTGSTAGKAIENNTGAASSSAALVAEDGKIPKARILQAINLYCPRSQGVEPVQFLDALRNVANLTVDCLQADGHLTTITPSHTLSWFENIVEFRFSSPKQLYIDFDLLNLNSMRQG